MSGDQREEAAEQQAVPESRCAMCGRDIHADFQVAGMLHYGLTESVGLHPFVPASVEDDEDGPLLVCERCERGVNLLLDGLCDACESTPAGEGARETARTLMRAIEDIREPGARTYPVMVALANHEAAIRAPLEEELRKAQAELAEWLERCEDLVTKVQRPPRA